MSGARQHFIPRFLQRGFASHSIGDDFYTWVYRKGVKPFNANIINVGAEGQFYSNDGDNRVDDEITAIEGRLGALIDALRSDGDKAAADSASLAELIAHLEIRTRHLRQNLLALGDVVTEEVLRFADNHEAFGSFIRRQALNNPAFLRPMMLEGINKLGLSKAQSRQLLRNTAPLMKQMLPSLLAKQSSAISQIRAELPMMLKRAAKAGHIKALGKSISPPVKAERYLSLKFRTMRSTELEFSLGDSILLFQMEGERKFKPFCDKDDVVQAVYLPLNPGLILVGSDGDRTIDLSPIPMAIARCSLEYFISNSTSGAKDEQQSHIGESAHLLSQDEIDALIAEVINQ